MLPSSAIVLLFYYSPGFFSPNYLRISDDNSHALDFQHSLFKGDS